DSALVLSVMEGFDGADSYSRPRPMSAAPMPLAKLRVAVPANRRLSNAYEAAFCAYLDQLQPQTARLQEMPFDLLFEVASLLYQGPWVAERIVGARKIYERQPEQMLPVIRQVLDVARQFSAADTFAAQYRLQALKRKAETIWE